MWLMVWNMSGYTATGPEYKGFMLGFLEFKIHNDSLNPIEYSSESSFTVTEMRAHYTNIGLLIHL